MRSPIVFLCRECARWPCGLVRSLVARPEVAKKRQKKPLLRNPQNHPPLRLPPPPKSSPIGVSLSLSLSLSLFRLVRALGPRYVMADWQAGRQMTAIQTTDRRRTDRQTDRQMTDDRQTTGTTPQAAGRHTDSRQTRRQQADTQMTDRHTDDRNTHNPKLGQGQRVRQRQCGELEEDQDCGLRSEQPSSSEEVGNNLNDEQSGEDQNSGLIQELAAEGENEHRCYPWCYHIA